MSFGKENVCEFTIVNISYFSKPGNWLGKKILVNGVCFTKFAKVFPCKNFALYGRTYLPNHVGIHITPYHATSF